MKNNKKGIVVAACIVGIVVVVVVGGWIAGRAAHSEEEKYVVSEALLIREDEKELQGNYLLVDTGNGTPFTGTFPDGNIFDEEGKKVSADDLKNGDVLKIYGDGIMLESYPGQYPGIGKMELLRRQDQELLERYYGIFEDTRVTENPSELPWLNLEYRQPEAVVCAMVDTYGEYEWSYENADGDTVSERTDSPVILQWERYAEINIPQNVKIKLLFSKEPEEVIVKRYPSSAAKSVSGQENTEETISAEEVLTETAEEGRVLDGEPGYLYSVYAKWENGEAEYGFMTFPMPSLS